MFRRLLSLMILGLLVNSAGAAPGVVITGTTPHYCPPKKIVIVYYPYYPRPRKPVVYYGGGYTPKWTAPRTAAPPQPTSISNPYYREPYNKPSKWTPPLRE